MYTEQTISFKNRVISIAILGFQFWNPALASGEEVYKKACAMCHATGVSGSPKLGDKQAWKSRIGLGINTLTKNAISGIRSMPAKGGCTTCSDDDIKSAVEYIVKSSS